MVISAFSFPKCEVEIKWLPNTQFMVFVHLMYLLFVKINHHQIHSPFHHIHSCPCHNGIFSTYNRLLVVSRQTETVVPLWITPRVNQI
jgi:hypothetical protein